MYECWQDINDYVTKKSMANDVREFKERMERERHELPYEHFFCYFPKDKYSVQVECAFYKGNIVTGSGKNYTTDDFEIRGFIRKIDPYKTNTVYRNNSAIYSYNHNWIVGVEAAVKLDIGKIFKDEEYDHLTTISIFGFSVITDEGEKIAETLFPEQWFSPNKKEGRLSTTIPILTFDGTTLHSGLEWKNELYQLIENMNKGGSYIS